MAKFSSSMLENIRQISIDRIIEPYVDLKSRGRDLWGLCPFHNEKSPSFKVDVDKGFFKCFGCDAKGDGVTFIMRRLGFSYPDAVLYLAEHFGINVEYDGEENFRSKDIISLHEEIQAISRKLFYSDEGRQTREYIKQRSFDDNDFNDFGIGYLSNNVDYTKIYKSFSKNILYDSGFFKESKYGTPYSRFFNRLMLPIRNVTGSIAAFAGRSIDGSNPKYLNSAESSIFHKSYTLFNIDKAKDTMKQTHEAIIVEGYFDVIRLYKSGFKNAAAPMGTALTVDQISLLKRYADEITVIFDGDEAGISASSRSLKRFTELSIFPKVVFLPDGEDPDSFILKHGPDEFRKLYNKREDLFINVSKRLAYSVKDDINLKLSRFQSIKEMLMKVENIHLRDYYIEAVADIFKLKKENIQEEIIESRYKKSNVAKSVKKDTGRFICELDFIACISRLPIDTVDKLLHNINLEIFNDDEIKNILKKILEFLPNIIDIKQITHELGDYFVDTAMRDIDGKDIYAEAVKNKNQIELNYLKRRQKELIEGIQADAENKIKILHEINSLTKQIIEKSKEMENR